MKNKQLILLLFISILGISVLCVPLINNNKENKMKTKIDDLLTVKYSKQTLDNYFNARDEKGYRMKYDLKTINRYFQIQIMRTNYGKKYIIYAVEEGGLYFVFLDEHDYKYSEAVYLTKEKLNTKNDFKQIKKKKHTVKDVEKLSKNFYHPGWTSYKQFSDTVLDNGQVMQVEYEYSPLKQELVVLKKDTENIDRYTPLSFLLKEDILYIAKGDKNV